MSAIRSEFGDIGYAGLRMTADEYLALGETQERYELIHGVVTMTPSPSVPLAHGEIAYEIIGQLHTFAAGGRVIRVFPETDVRLSPSCVYRPDLCVYLAEHLPGRVQRLETPPDLVVEILSPGSKALDLITKRDDFERFGVHEYWVVDPVDGRVRCWQRREGQLIEAAVSGDALTSAAIAGFVLRIGPIRGFAGGDSAG